MNTGQLVCGLPLYELPPVCAEVVRRLNNLETDAQTSGDGSPVWLTLDALGADRASLRPALEDRLICLAQRDGDVVVLLTDWGRSALVHGVELGPDGLPPSGAREEFVRSFEETTRDLAGQVSAVRQPLATNRRERRQLARRRGRVRR